MSRKLGLNFWSFLAKNWVGVGLVVAKSKKVAVNVGFGVDILKNWAMVWVG